MTSTAPAIQSDLQHLVHSLHSHAAQQRALVWTAGDGALLYDQHGKAYYDALAGLWNVILGHGRRELAEAASRQMMQLPYASCYAGFSNPPAIALGERLAEVSYPGLQRFFFTSGGAEANESAMKTARFYWKAKGRPDKTGFIGRQWGYHGTTLAAMSATGIASYWPMFEPRIPGFSHVASPYPYRFAFTPRDASDARTPGQAAADLLEEEILRRGADTVAAFIGEPVQGAAGVIVPPDDYWPRIREICNRHQVLLIADEVITGFGRTGDWFALRRYGVEPDILTFAKGITSGYFPMGGVAVNADIAAAIDAGQGAGTWMHAFTYSGHPVGCAVALATLDVLQQEGLVQRAAELGQTLQRKLQTLTSHPNVGDVRGLGLMGSVELVADRATKAEFPAEQAVGPKVHAATIERGMVTRLRGDCYNFAPCYATTEADLERMVQILGESIEAVLPG